MWVTMLTLNLRDNLFRVGPLTIITIYLELDHRIDKTKVQIGLMNKPTHVGYIFFGRRCHSDVDSFLFLSNS